MRFLLLMRGADPDEADGAFEAAAEAVGGESESRAGTLLEEEAGEAVEYRCLVSGGLCPGLLMLLK